MVHYKLYYFPGRGAGETIRQIFAVAKQEYEDIRISKDDWPQHKGEMPFGQMPVLEEDGKKLAQSGAIARYLARKFGLTGQSSWDEAQIEALADQWKDFTTEIRPYARVVMGMAEGDLEKLKTDVFLPAIHKHFPFFVKALKTSGSGYLYGDKLTWIDLPVAEYMALMEEKVPEALENYPELREHKEKVHSNPELKKWRETRPQTAF